MREKPARRVCRPALTRAATLFRLFGLDPASELRGLTGRPYRLADGRPLRSLFVG